MDPSSPTNRCLLSRPMSNSVAFRHKRPVLFGLLSSIVLLLVISGSIAIAHPAHAEYVSSDPTANAMLAKTPTMITIHFSESVDPSGSNISVYDVDGKPVNTADGQVARSDLKTMTVTMKGDQSEVYVVNWHTVSAMEGHHDSGSFRFFVNISPMLKGMVGNPSMSGSSTSSSASGSMSSGSSSSGVPLWITVLVGVLGLIIGGVVVFAFARRSSSSAKVG
ncbi:MAG TPA: copper resistance CopC family protein [Ktedonobacteraceae bacterium]